MITKKQHAILSFIESFVAEKGYSPSYREIMARFSLNSPGSIYKYIQTLKKKNLLSVERGCGKSLRPTKAEPDRPAETAPAPVVELPFIGHVEAGRPIEIFPKNQTVVVPKFLVQHPDSTYVLRVRGNSLVEEHLEDGDLLLVEARSEAQAGETVLALINKHDTVILLYHPEGPKVRLTGKNPQHHPIILRHENIQIQGVLVSLLRAY